MKEKVLLVIVIDNPRSQWTPEDDTAEMTELIHSCGGEVVHTVICKTMPPTASHLLTKGKVEEIAVLCQAGGVDCVIVSRDLKGVQQRNLEADFGVKTIDRTQVILDIFAKHATSLEGKMQVELAQLQYMLPRLVGRGPELSRQGGGIGTSGPGETKLEVDRRRIGDRIARLKSDLKHVQENRHLKRKQRMTNDVPTVALVGYTNAGKSTLMNALTNANTRSHDGVFTTLDSLSRQTTLPNNRPFVLTDTVGFMHDLPHTLIEAFKATLEEVRAADVLLHVIDISNDNYHNYYEAVNKVLEELKAKDKPTILVCNKIDRIDNPKRLKDMSKYTTHVTDVSAKTGQNLNKLLLLLEDLLSEGTSDINLLLPKDRMDLINLAYANGHVEDVKFLSKGIRLKAALPAKIAATISRLALIDKQ